MDEALLSRLSQLIVLGVPIAAVAGLALRRGRSVSASVLGASLPWLAFYGWVLLGEDEFADGALWLMAAPAYIVVLLLATALGLLRWPDPILARMGVGLLANALGVAVFVVLGAIQFALN